MKKTLSILLALTMLASLCAVPAWAEDATLDLPVIEEVTEEELTEVDLFGEEIELMADEDFAAIETAEDDGITLLSEIDGVDVSFQNVTGKGSEGALASLYNGQITVGDDLGGQFIKDGDVEEGYMIFKGDTITIDFGEKKAFSGIRLWDSSRTRYFGTYGTDGTGATPKPGARRIATSTVYFSDDGENWYSTFPATGAYNEDGLYSDLLFPMNGKGAKINLNARYIKFEATSVTEGWGELEMEEIAMIDANSDLKTWSLDGHEIPNSAIESVVAGSEWNTISYKVSNAYDGMISLSSYWHSIANATDHVYTDDDRSFVITLKEKTKIGGIRLWPRNDATAEANAANTATMRKVRLMGSEDGTNWYNITSVTADLHNTYSANGYMMPVDILVSSFIDSDLKYIKVVGEKVDNYVCLAEFQLLDEGAKTGTASAYLSDDDVVTWKTVPAQTAFYSSLGKNIATNASVFDGQVHQVINEGEGYYATWLTANNDPHWEIDNALTGDGYVTVDFDLGKSYTFSGARIFGRWNQPGQALTKGHIWVSDDGENWYKSDSHEDGGTTVSIPFEGGAIANVALAKYASTGEIYTDIPTTFGDDYNITARYIRVHCAETGGGNHWSFQELLLTVPDNANPTKTATELGAILKAEADEVTAIINALSASSAMEDIEEARVAYDALTEGAKELVSADTLKKLTDAEALIEGSIYEMAVALSTGLNKATFTLPVRSDMTIKSVTYTDTLGNVIDGTDAATVTNDGTNMTITIAGGYETATGLTDYTNESKGTLYFGTANTTYGWTAGQEIKSAFFTGSFVRKVTADGVGNHYITITFGDDSTATVNIKTTADFIQLTSAAAIEGSEYDDEITPKTTWKATTSIRNRDMNKAFDGQVEYLIRKGGATTANRYETDFVAGKYTANVDLSGAVEQVLLYPPVRLDFILDTGEETEISGIRIYPRISSYKEDKTAGTAAGAPTQIRYWGSDDGENWVSLGDYTFTTNITEKTAKFSDIASYRYYKGSITKSNGMNYKQTISISEIALLKAETMLTSDDDVTVDASENKAAEFTFALVGDETVASLKNAENNDVAYTFADGTLTITKETVATLANGENVFTVTFTNNAKFTLTVNKTDTSKVTYMLFDESNGTGALVLANTSAKEVTALKLENGTELEFTQSDDKKEISVIRQHFRRSSDLFSLIDVNKGGEVKVVATFSDETTKTYTVTVDAAWVAVTGTSGEFADDEIPAKTTWKARVSSALNVNQPSNVLSAKKIGIKDQQNWHSFHSTVNGVGGTGDSTAAIGHYLEVDFGEDVTPYTGIRHLERPGGTTWNSLVTVTGKNSAEEEWTEVYSAKPYYEKVGEYTVGENSVPIYSSDILFGEAVSYRYLRIHIVSTSNHITADTIHFIKDKVTFTGPEKAVIDKDNVTDAKFTFHVPADAEGRIYVWVSSVTLDEANYTWDKETGTLTLKADYLKTLGTATFAIKVQIDSSEYFDMDVELKDYYSETYYFTETENARGTENLVINVPEGKTLSTLKYGDKDVTFTQAEDKATVLRYNFRGLDNFFEVDSVTLNAIFSDETTATYTVNLEKEWFEVPEADEALFLDDEILPDMWYATTMSINSNDNGVARLFNKTGSYWHSAYTEDRSNPDDVKAVADSEEGRHYITLSTDSGVTFSGIRYYSRTDNLAGTWDGVTVYVRTLDEEEGWTLVKSQNFDKTTLNETRVATVYFDEPVYADEVLIVADAGHYKYATAKAITLLKEGTSAPDAEEDEVKIDVTPTTGGNVYIDGVPSLGSANVSANDSITLTADAAGFKYWIEANTGKILGTDATTGITINTSVGKDIKAVFTDPSAFEAFYAFIGRDGGKLVSSGYVKKGNAPVAPSVDQLYTTGYSFVKWVDKNGGDVDVTAKINAETEYYALYEAKATKQSKITVTNGTIGLFDGTDEAASEKTYAYDTKVKAVAAEAEEGQKFAYWTIDEKIVCYTETYIFFAPDMDVALTAVYVAEDAVVEKAVGITMTVSQDTVEKDEETVLVASFLTTRVVPDGVTVLETGVIYVKDDDVTDLTTEMIGTTTADGKKIKVALCDSKVSGQYKLTASYKDYGGISARGFITYLDGEEVKTAYTDFYKIDCSEN